MDACVILNRHAGVTGTGRNGADPAALAEAFSAAAITAQVRVADTGRLEDEFDAAIAQRPDVLVVGGGDGTVSAAAAHLVGSDVPLGVLPLGTLNHFAKDLGIPVDWRLAIQALASAEVRAVDVGEVNGRVFVNNCSLGLYAEAVRKRDMLRARHGLGKWGAMLLASWRVFRALRRMPVELDLEHGVVSLRTPLLVISNNRYTGHVLNGSVRARLDEGQLWLHTTRVHRRFTLLRLALQILRRRVDQVDHLECQGFTTGTLTTSAPALPIVADGELLPVHAPMRFRIRPRALKVFVPRHAAS